MLNTKNAVFWDVTPRGFCKNRRFGGAAFLRNVRSYKSHRRNMPENGILHSHSSENLKSYIALTGWTL
jgi:hypothetical protein